MEDEICCAKCRSAGGGRGIGSRQAGIATRGARKCQPECQRTRVFVDQRAVPRMHSLANVVDGSIGVSMIHRHPSEFIKPAYNCRSVMTCEGQANLGLRQSIRNRAHGHLGDDSFCDRGWDN